MSSVEELLIYKANFNLIYYTEMIVKKFPKVENNFLVKDIRGICFDNQRLVIKTYKEVNRTKKIYYLNEIDCNLKMLKVMVRVAYKKRYISPKYYGAWAKIITNVNNLLYGWLKNA